MQALDTKLMSQKASLANQLWQAANEPHKDRNGNTYTFASTTGADSVKQIIQDQLAPYDQMHEALGNKQFGLAMYHANQAVARLGDRKDNLSQGPMGEKIDTFAVLNEKMGPAFGGMLAAKLATTDIPDQMRALFNDNAVSARAQPDFDKNGKLILLNQHLDEAATLEKQGKITSSMRARYTQGLVNIVDDLNDPKMPTADKENVVRYLFSPEGQGILKRFKTEYTDPNTNRTVPGKYAVWTRLSSPDVVNSIAKLSQTDPSIGRQYKSYMENEAGSELFYKEFQNLNFMTGHDDLHFKYTDGANGGSPYIELLDKGGRPVNNIYGAISQAPSQIQNAQKVVGRLNQALAGMSNIEKGLGGDVNQYVLEFMQHAQTDFGKNWTGLPAKLMDSIAASRSPSRRIEDTFKNLNTGQ